MAERRANPGPARLGSSGAGGAGGRRLPLDEGRAHEVERSLVPAALALLSAAAALLDVGHRGAWWASAVACVAAATWSWRRRTFGKAWLLVDDREVARVDGRGRTPLLDWSAPYGVSVLADASRTWVVLAFTTPRATRFLRVRVESARDADHARDVLELAVTVSEEDLDAAVPEGSAELAAQPTRDLFDEIARRDPHATERMYLADARGMAVVVDRDYLAVGERTFDLATPLEWRVFAFVDGDEASAATYQATAIRQGTSEAVLVCRASPELTAWTAGKASDAPPADARVAIDRLFMTPLRSVLARAPRAPRPGAPSRDRGRTIET